MKLAWLSDLHLDMVSKEVVVKLGRKLHNFNCEAVIISGDIASATSGSTLLDLLEENVQKPIYYVHGNHDFYMGSFNNVRSNASLRSEQSTFTKWVQHEGVIRLTKSTCLVGHDGWYDGRFGDFYGFGISSGNGMFELTDFNLIEDIKAVPSRDAKLLLFNNLADHAAAHIRQLVRVAATSYKTILILTHVPPFAEVSLKDGHPSPSYSLPFYSCKVLSETLLDLKEEFPEKNLIVFCGHTHYPAELHIDNLHVYVAGAIYGTPDIYTTIDIED